MQNMVYHAVETSHVYENTGVNVREWTGRSNIFDKSSRWSSWKACGGRLAMVCRCSLSLPFPRTEGGRGEESIGTRRKKDRFLSLLLCTRRITEGGGSWLKARGEMISSVPLENYRRAQIVAIVTIRKNRGALSGFQVYALLRWIAEGWEATIPRFIDRGKFLIGLD